MSTSVIGVILITRHGDRLSFPQDPSSYFGTEASLTALGQQEQVALGELIGRTYLNTSSPSVINAVSLQNTISTNGTYVPGDVLAYADDNQASSIKLDSAVALFQGMYPPNGDSSPLSGYQYVPVRTVASENEYWMESWTSCPAFRQNADAVYASQEFQRQAQLAAPAFEAVQPIYPSTALSLRDAWNVWDYVNVQNIHNETFASEVEAIGGTNLLTQLRHWANYKEQAVFTSFEPKSPANLPIGTVLPFISQTIQGYLNPIQIQRFTYLSVSYKPFLSFFNMTQVAQQSPALGGFPDYSAAMVLELRQDTNRRNYVRLNFKNGTVDADFQPLVMFNSGRVDLPLETFAQRIEPYAVSSLNEWCTICENDFSKGCQLISRINGTASQGQLSPTAAGLIGFGATTAFFLIVIAAALLWQHSKKYKGDKIGSREASLKEEQ